MEEIGLNNIADGDGDIVKHRQYSDGKENAETHRSDTEINKSTALVDAIMQNHTLQRRLERYYQRLNITLNAKQQGQ